MNLITDFLKTHEKIVAITVLGFLYVPLIAQYATEYLLDPNAGVMIIVLSIGWLFVIILFNRFKSNKAKSNPKNPVSFSSLSLSQKMFGVLFPIFFLVSVPYTFWAKTFDNISRLKTESPFFEPTRETIINNLNTKVDDFNEIVRLMEELNANQITISMRNQDVYRKYYPEIILKLKSLEIPFAAKYPNQISLSVFKSKKKDIIFLSTSTLTNTQSESCTKIKINFYFCTFETP